MAGVMAGAVGPAGCCGESGGGCDCGCGWDVGRSDRTDQVGLVKTVSKPPFRPPEGCAAVSADCEMHRRHVYDAAGPVAVPLGS